MDSPPKKRRFWQFHLSTGVILMVVAGVVLAANARKCVSESPWKLTDEIMEYSSTEPSSFVSSGRRSENAPIQHLVYHKSCIWERQSSTNFGWPFSFYQQTYIGRIGLETGIQPPPEQAGTGSVIESLLKQAILYDAFVAVSILASTALVCEWLIRRREARKP